MPVETSSSFTEIIQAHLDLKQRNARLEQVMPLERYKTRDPFENHPLFKTEEQARLEETMDGQETIFDGPATLAADETLEDAGPEAEDGLWTRSRDFDWGD
jgi:hypothetical protein